MKKIELIIFIAAFVFSSTAKASDRGYLFLKGGATDPLMEIEAPSRYGTIQTETSIGLYLDAGLDTEYWKIWG